MNVLNPGYRQPVRSLQTFLREISHYYPQIPLVIPDGIFGVQTRAAVMQFQTVFSLPVTGEVENDTWDHIINVHDSVTQLIQDPVAAHIFPSAQTVVYPDESHSFLYVVQSILYGLSLVFSNIGPIRITGTHDGLSISTVKTIQSISGLEETGVLDRSTWDRIAQMYEVFVSHNRTVGLNSLQND